jgi:hypothetical protein
MLKSAGTKRKNNAGALGRRTDSVGKRLSLATTLRGATYSRGGSRNTLWRIVAPGVCADKKLLNFGFEIPYKIM